MLYSKLAYINPEYQRRGILSETMLFVKKTTNKSILSDTHMSYAGEALWKSLEKSTFLDVKIVDLKTNVTFDKTDVGELLPDETPAQLPEDDNQSNDYYNRSTRIGQRFFYMIESSNKFTFTENGRDYDYGYIIESNKNKSFFGPYGYYKSGDL